MSCPLGGELVVGVEALGLLRRRNVDLSASNAVEVETRLRRQSSF